MNLSRMTAADLIKGLDSGTVSNREIMESVLDSISEQEPKIQAYITIRPQEELLAEAQSIDDRREKGEKIGLLAGLPIAVKDNMCTKDIRTTCASRILENFNPPYDATVVEKIRAADGIIIGKTNMDEFAMGSSTENSAFKITHNPHDLNRVPGGTSGGSAAAIAAHECILAVGSDTGGSIRQPASFCGVVGCKPTYGRVSRYGLIAYGSSLDQIGSIAKGVSDAALLLTVLSGYDPRDSTSINTPVPRLIDDDEFNSNHFRVGVPNEYFGEGLDQEVRIAVEQAIELLKNDGNEVVELSLPHTKYVIPSYYLCVCSEASSNLARYDGVQYGFRVENAKNIIDLYCRTRSLGFGDEVKRRIILGTFALSAGYYDAYYLRALKARTLISRDFESAFKRCDVLMHPVAPTPAYRIGEMTDDPLAMYLGDIYSVSANLIGFPAISIPCGKTKTGLPIGVQIAAKPLAEPTIFAAALKLEKLLAESGAWTSEMGAVVV